MENEKTIVIDGVVYSEDKRVLIKYPEDSSEERFFIPDFVEELGVSCFAHTKNTKHIFISKNVKKIGNRALGDQFCFVIQQIYVPSTVTELEGEIFDYGREEVQACRALPKVPDYGLVI